MAAILREKRARPVPARAVASTSGCVVGGFLPLTTAVVISGANEERRRRRET